MCHPCRGIRVAAFAPGPTRCTSDRCPRGSADRGPDDRAVPHQDTYPARTPPHGFSPTGRQRLSWVLVPSREKHRDWRALDTFVYAHMCGTYCTNIPESHPKSKHPNTKRPQTKNDQASNPTVHSRSRPTVMSKKSTTVGTSGSPRGGTDGVEERAHPRICRRPNTESESFREVGAEAAIVSTAVEGVGSPSPVSGPAPVHQRSSRRRLVPRGPPQRPQSLPRKSSTVVCQLQP